MLVVRSPGLLTSIQDGGRPDAARLGVPRAGACDPEGHAVANVLLGNPRAAPALETALAGLVISVEATTVIAIGGADLGARVVDEDRPLAAGTASLVRAGSTVQFAGGPAGARAYLAVPGGLDVPAVLGSAAASPGASLPGLAGRPLRPGDRLAPRRPGDATHAGAAWPVPPLQSGSAAMLRVVAGPHRDRLRAAAELLLDATWRVGEHSDRAGVRLEAKADAVTASLSRAVATLDVASLPMRWGAVQVPAAGSPICLLPDHGTLGGYPVPFVVATVDRPILGQLRAGDVVRFAEVSADEARRLLLAAEAEFERAAALVARSADWEALADAAG